MPRLVNITDTLGPGFAWRSAMSGALWWEALRKDPIFAPRWNRVKAHPNGCWFLQMAPANRSGHVHLSLGVGRRVYAHRHAYQVAYGEIPRGRVVRHACDDPACINPAHLSIGSQHDNIHDCIARNRRNAWGRQRLTAADVMAIRRRFAAGESQAALRAAYGVSKGCIHAVVYHLTWAHLAQGRHAGDSIALNSSQREGEACSR